MTSPADFVVLLDALESAGFTWTQDGRGHFVRLNLHGWLTEPLGR